MKKMNIAKTGPADLLPQKFVITNVLGVPLRSSPVFILLFGLFVTFNNTSSLTYSNNIDLEYTYATTLDISLDTNTGFIIDNLTPGTSAYSNTVTVTASSNNSDGYNLLASVGDNSDINRNNNRLVNTDNTDYFESIATNANLELASLGDNKWGYSIYDTTNSTWSNYNGLPAIVTDTNGDINHNSDVTLASSNISGSTDVLMRIGASATNTQVSGTYTNNINFTVTAKVVTYDYIITYSANDGNPTSDGNNTVDTTNMPSNTSGSLQTGQELLTSSNVPVRNNYEFLGWCDGVVDRSNCNGVSYQPSDYIKIANASSVNNNTVTLSSIWCMTTITGTMQDFNPCDDLPINTTGILQDARDNQNYTIAKLKDGKWWMTKNLNLAGETEITSDLSDVPEGYILPTENGFGENNKLPVSSTTGFSDNNIAYVYNSSSSGYYSWTAATVGSGLNIANNTDAPYSICPKNWHLPSIDGRTNDQHDLKMLIVALGGSINRNEYTSSTTPTGSFLSGVLLKTPYNFQRVGHFVDGELKNTFVSYAWTAVSNSSTHAKRFYVESGYVEIGGANVKYTGNPVRCLLRR